MNIENMNSVLEKSRALMDKVEETKPYKIPKQKTGSMEFAQFESQAGLAPSKSSSNYSGNEYMQQQLYESNTNIEASPIQYMAQQQMPSISAIYEQRMNAPQMQYQQPTSQQYMQPQQNGAIDYNYLKYIIKECVTEVLTQNKKILSESSGNVKAMKVGSGNKIQFLDTKGNLYEGVLSLKKKAENKQ